ncbi:competence protein ComEC [Maridesulfovibrio ferrireducens]|uniref:Competence protein ComEC n=1 Tax=Maridesulfovibrio ferrireducens TaxID=246191 RepID=A0A1G9L6R3_9BACT|nr:DNA internalization-related competence protein ComEC/Rec2 [Maridesulfovibrio ferrireducens]SDL57650.1 competence protein ComEC [Maridesulfovibrio ferrireducens]
MNRSDSKSCLVSRPGIPGLLFWQKLVPAFVFGILSIKWLLPCFVAFFVYVVILFSFRLQKGTIVLLVLMFALGSFYASAVLPVPPGGMPDWMASKEKVHVNAEIAAIKGVPGNRLKIILKNVLCTTSHKISGENNSETVNETTKLAGYLLWTWEKPDVFPVTGQQVNLLIKVKPIHGFKNAGVWDYDFYNRTKNIFYRFYTRGPLKNGELKPVDPGFWERLRADLRNRIVRNTPSTQGGAIFPALLTGDRFFLSRDTVELIRRAGVSHLLALSGLHVGFVASIGFAFAWLIGLFFPQIYLKIPRIKLAVILATPLVLFYLWLGQFSPSLLRAVCMFGFWGLLLLMNRGRVLLDGLFLAVVLILTFSPLSAFDLGFQLSVLAVGGIAVFYPYFQSILPAGITILGKVTHFILAVLAVSLCANITILPITIWNFGVLIPNLVFNVLWIPLLGFFLMPVCGVGSLVMSFVNTAVSQKLFSLGAACFDEMFSLVRTAVSAGWLPEYAFYRPLWQDFIIYYVLLLLCLSLHKSRKVKLTAVCMIVLLVGSRIGVMYNSGELPGIGSEFVKVDLLDTGQSQGLVITGPRGTRTVVDGGGSFGDSFDIGRAIVGPWLASGHLPKVDNIILTHADRDHCGGLAYLLEKFDVGHYYSDGNMPGGVIGERFKKAFSENELVPEKVKRGDIIELEPGLILQVLHPASDFKGTKNNRSLFLRLVWNGKGLICISGDVEKSGIKTLLRNNDDLSADVLVLPHHGSAGAYSPELYGRVSPKIAVAACGFLNRYNFVVEKVECELRTRKIKIYKTSEKGMISAKWNKLREIIIRP